MSGEPVSTTMTWDPVSRSMTLLEKWEPGMLAQSDDGQQGLLLKGLYPNFEYGAKLELPDGTKTELIGRDQLKVPPLHRSHCTVCHSASQHTLPEYASRCRALSSILPLISVHTLPQYASRCT